mgnify:CR=1 FL=1
MLNVSQIKVKFGKTEVVRGVSFDLKQGEILSVIGESGAGKSVLAMSMLKLYDEKIAQISADHMTYCEIDLLKCDEKAYQNLRGKALAYIFQNPNDALSPNKTIRNQFKELCSVHQIPYVEADIVQMFMDVGLDEEAQVVLSMYPKQLSGGLAQRVTIAMALLLKPKVIIADEPTSSIDASLTQVIVSLLVKINQKYDISLMFITHDIELAMQISNRIMIMYGGLVMEYGEKERIAQKPLHPYTQELMKCVRSINSSESPLYSLPGYALDPSQFKSECPFVNRCMVKSEMCTKSIPLMSARGVRCVHEIGVEVLNEH